MKNSVSNGLNALDWLVALGTLSYGAYTGSLLWIAGGVLGLGMAWYNPGKRIKALIEKKMQRKTVPVTLKVDELASLPAVAEARAAAEPAVPVSFGQSTSFSYGPQYPMANKHNALRGNWWNSYPSRSTPESAMRTELGC